MFYNWASDSAVTRYLSWSPHVNPEESAGLLQRWVAEYEKPENYHWGIVPKEGRRVFGSIGVVNMSEHDLRCEVGYCIGRALWGRGLTTEALMAAIWYLFEYTDFNRIQARHDVRNIGSGRVMQKAGMTCEGTLRQHSLNRSDGTMADMNICAILRSEYEARI
jgi:ribosomal-protein-alanine N-acetyltransferase